VFFQAWPSFMKNIIKLDIEFADVPGTIWIEHNGQLLQQIGHSGSFTIECDHLTGPNCLEVYSDVGIHIAQLSMFDQGQEKLVYQGQCVNDQTQYQSQDVPAGYRWRVEYSGPVFSWLHSVLAHGWLVGA
jgi:hypothetical protein